MLQITNSKFFYKDPKIYRMDFKINEIFNKNIFEKYGKELHVKFMLTKPKYYEDKPNTAFLMFGVDIGGVSDFYPYHLCAEVGADFTWEDDCDKKTLDCFFQLNGPALLLGYLRPYIMQFTSLTPTGAIQLPFYAFTYEPDETNKLEENK